MAFLSSIDTPRVTERRIYFVRGHKIMLDWDLAELYGVPTKVFNQAVRRNKDRFPEDFMFQLSWEETRDWQSAMVAMGSKSQFVTLKRGQNIKFRPYAFTEHGILMLSSVLNSARAIRVNIEIMRTFVRLRQMLASHKALAARLDDLEQKYDTQFKAVFDAIRELMMPPDKPQRRMGFEPQN